MEINLRMVSLKGMGMDFIIYLKLVGRLVADVNIGLNVLVQHFFLYPISIMWSW